MQEISTFKLDGVALDWAVAMCCSVPVAPDPDAGCLRTIEDNEVYSPSRNEFQAAQVFEHSGVDIYRELGDLWAPQKMWLAARYVDSGKSLVVGANNPWLAMLRLFVYAHVGESVLIPDQVLQIAQKD